MPSAWHSLNLGETIPKVGACYALFGDGKLLYIGSTKNLFTRFYRGHSNASYMYRARTRSWVTIWGEFRSVIIKFRPVRKFGDWAMIELRLIKRLKPPGNWRGLGRAPKIKSDRTFVATLREAERPSKPFPRGLTFSSGYRSRT